MPVGLALVNNPASLQWSPFEEHRVAVCRVTCISSNVQVATANRPGHTPTSGIIYFLDFLPHNDVEIDTQVNLNIGAKQLAWYFYS